MRDFRQTFTALDQRAVGTITVDDYASLVGVKASGTIEVVDWSLLPGVQASGTIEVLDYTKLAEAAATGSIVVADITKLVEAKAVGRITVVDYTQLAGKKFTLNGVDFVEGVHFDAETSNAITIDNIVAALAANDLVDATDQTTYVKLEVKVAGTAGNAITLSTDGGADMTIQAFAGGQDNAIFTVNAIDYEAGVDFTVETDEATTATNLEAVIDDDTDLATSVLSATITINAATAGVAGNSIGVAYVGTAGGATISGALLTGGQANATITVGSDTLTQGTGFTAETSEAVTAENIKVAVAALVGVGATRTDNTVTVTADAVGTAGNAKALTATGTAGGLTLSGSHLENGRAHATITVGTDTLTQGSDFTAETDDATTAENIKTAIHNLSGVSATRNTNTVTVQNDALGVVGNSKALTATYPTGALTLSGATLEDGVDPCVVTINVTALTEQTNFTAATSNEATATSLASAIDGVAGVNAAAVGNVITIHADAPGTAGNVAMTSDWDGAPNTGLTLSGATLEGGVAVTYSDIFDYDTQEDVEEIEEVLNVTAKTGTLTLDVTPQYSFDKVNFFDCTAFAQKSNTGTEALNRTTTGLYTRYKIVMGGTNPTATFQISAVAK